MDLTADFYRKVLDNLYDGIYFVDERREIVYWNPGAEKHTGYAAAEVMGKHWDGVLSHVDAQGTRISDGPCPILQTASDGKLREIDVYFHHKEGHRVPVSLRIAPIEGSEGQIVVAVEIVSEKSPRFTLRQKIEELRAMTLLDPLTKLGNRRHIEMSVQGRLEEMHRYGWPFGILFVDIDHFKTLNDRYGHDVGDRVLNMVGKTISNTLRSFDVVGRWGGEEFIVVLVNVRKDQLKAVAERVRSLIGLSDIDVGGESVGVTVSVGATLGRLTDTVDTVVVRADHLMYRSKSSGRNLVSMDAEE